MFVLFINKVDGCDKYEKEGPNTVADLDLGIAIFQTKISSFKAELVHLCIKGVINISILLCACSQCHQSPNREFKTTL